MTDQATYEGSLSRASRRMLELSLVTPRACRCGGCICLTPRERRTMQRVGKIVRQWKRQTRRRARAVARARAEARR